MTALTDSQGYEVPTERVVPRITSGEVARRAAAFATRGVTGRGRTDKEVASMIEKFGIHPNGYPRASVIVGEERFYLHRRYGSWMLPAQVKGVEVLKEPEAVFGPVLGRELKLALQAAFRREGL